MALWKVTAQFREDFENVTMKHAVCFHGKFFDLNEEGDDRSVPTGRIPEVINRSNYEGYISIEYEGHAMYPERPVVPILRKHVEFYRNVLHI